MTTLDAAQKGIETFLRQKWRTAVTVTALRPASAGARRLNLLFDAQCAGERLELAATIAANPALQTMPIGVEASNLRFAERARVPAPKLHAVCEDPRFVGGPFFVTGRVEGDTIPRHVLRRVAQRRGLGERMAEQCGAALARLHAAETSDAHPQLKKPAAPIAETLRETRAQIASLLQPSPTFTLAQRWLETARPPEPQRRVVVHGDFRNGNLIVGDDGLRAILDWEVTHLGDPMEDCGWLCQRIWRFRNDALEAGGFGTRDALQRGYREAGGVFDGARFHWWKVMGTLKWGLGLAAQARAHLDGSAPGIVMAASGRRVAEQEYDLLMLLKPEGC